MPDVLWESIPKIGSKVSKSAKAMSLAFVLLDFEHAGNVFFGLAWDSGLAVIVSGFYGSF